MKRLLDQLIPLVRGRDKDEGDLRRQIFRQPMVLSMDNHFPTKDVADFIGQHGFGQVSTIRRDRLPKDCKKESFHYVKAVAVDDRSRMARFEQPIVAVKHVEPTSGEPYNIVHVSFQSTGSTNIQTVNALSKVALYVRERNRGRGANKRVWGIEMNHARELYLKTYGAVDKLDQNIMDWGLDFISCKWWHAPMKHGMAIAFTMAYQMYRDCASGNVDPRWKLEKPMTGPEFRQRLGEQMCWYSTRYLDYPGDQFKRGTVRYEKNKRGRKDGNVERAEDGDFRVTYAQYLDAKYPRGRGKESRL